MRYFLIVLAFPLLALDNSVRLYDASGSTQTSQPRTIHRYFAQGEFPAGTYPKPRVGGSAPATWQVDVESTWPDGSVMAAFVSLPVSITANSSVVVDFVSDANPCHLGNLATCQAAALDQSGMLAFNGSAWDAVLSGTAGGLTYSANARTMMTAGACSQFLLRGPVVTKVVCEDLSRPNPAYDFGWQWDASANTANQANALGAFGSEGKRIGFRIAWKQTTGITRGSPSTVTAPSHGLSTGMQILLIGGEYAWKDSGRGVYTVTVIDADTFTIPLDSTGFGYDAPANHMQIAPTAMAVGIGSSDSLTPTDGVFLRLNWPQWQLAVRDGGVETTYDFGDPTRKDAVISYFEIYSEGSGSNNRIVFQGVAHAGGRTICASGCDITVAAGWLATNFLPIRRLESTGGGVVPGAVTFFRPDSWIAPSSDTYKSVHPLFTATFYAGWAGVELDAAAINGATTRLQRQVFDLTVKKSGGSVVYRQSGYDLARGTSFPYVFWDGDAPAAIQTDFNFKYLIHSRMLPPYEWQTARQGATDISGYNTIVGAGNPNDCKPYAGGCGNWTQYIGGTGARGDIGLIPRWYVTYGFAMGDTSTYTVAQRKELFDKGVVGNADAALSMPFWYLEYDNSAARDNPADGQRYYYDTAQTTPAFGQEASISARPEWSSGVIEATTGADKIVPICTDGICDGTAMIDPTITKGWTMDMAHRGGAFYLPYLLTGRYIYLRAQMSYAALGSSFPNWNCYNDELRCGDYGLMMLWGSQRSSAWSLREIASAALIAPSAWPQKAHYRRMLEKNDEMWEGIYGLSGGNTGTTTATDFCLGSANGTGSSYHGSGGDYHVTGNALGEYRLNGIARAFPGYHPLYAITGLTVGGVSKTWGIKGVDSGRDWYYYPGGITIFQDAGGTTPTTDQPINVTYQVSTISKPWCVGRHVIMKGYENNIGFPFWSSNKAYSSFMLYYMAWTRKWIEDTGAFNHSVTGQPLFKYSNAEMAKYLVGFAVDPNANMHYADGYTSFFVTPDNRFPATWTERIAAWPHVSTLAADLTNSATTIYVVDDHTVYPSTIFEMLVPAYVKVENEWIQVCSRAENTPSNQSTFTVCTGGRGAFGTAAVAHSTGATFDTSRNQWRESGYGHGYAALYTSAVAMYEEYSLPAGSGRRAWEHAMGTISGVNLRQTAPEYNFVPRDRIANVRASAGTGSISLAWTAPSPAACVVGINPATSDDSGDTTATGTSRAQSFAATGLAAGSTTYRITCGTARTTGTVTVQ